MTAITDLGALHAMYGNPGAAATRKVAPRLTATYRTWIERARFCILSTVGPEGTDGSPRGDNGPVVTVLDDSTLALPDWQGNERIDSLRNIVRDGRVSLVFLVAGSHNAMRVNGTAIVTADPGLCARFARDGKQPRTVIVIAISEVYSQCARALIRSALWTSGDQSAGLPTVGDMLRDITNGDVDGTTYDEAWPARAAQTMW
ncbi:MAG: pyridoxamine 5'-phosphate oxidase family protein [Pseudotabrizicola sp.]|uniref:pyridoxamine 5'-phosphate oxidase family protein n=1 Tax=Pseudotabrizicola sp. TaxID=2939647 RepID=UPI00272F2FC4|nr:pyridoxamine 5'-phosphate oxidase family protein [Pseudotabrizicola sp.]MDP2082062.1 pyridoxamine 5'-phosphate oxidase family protein [Pseudotabrizicola sp.]MDZ7576455.1 pyridoxamine 5'-phosphate oxidase family protein [Pseudotabrizicola sp.]